MEWLWIPAVWLASIPVSYLAVRDDYKQSVQGPYTNGDRLIWATLSLFGPFLIITWTQCVARRVVGTRLREWLNKEID